MRYLATVGGDVDLATGDGLLVARIKGAVAADGVAKIKRRVRTQASGVGGGGRGEWWRWLVRSGSKRTG